MMGNRGGMTFFVSTGGLGKGVMEERLLEDDTSNKF